MDFAYLGTVLLLVFGFGFVIFWHELGHFLAAKWAGVKVEQFAVGFGHALISWRKGLGVRRGTSRVEYEQKLRQWLSSQEKSLQTMHGLPENANEERRLEYASAQLGIGETEYRLNWIPLGGYVKMLGQDDMDPTAQSASPRAYNNKPIGQRMVIVSAGVIMNIILAIILFTLLFRIGFNVPPTLVGSIAPGSPAQAAGLRVGDRILYFDGGFQHDFNKIVMNVALAEEGTAVPVVVADPQNSERTVQLTPRHMPDDPTGVLRLGIGAAIELRGMNPEKTPDDWDKDRDLVVPDAFAIRPGDEVTAINGQPIENFKQFYKLDAALQQSLGKPVLLTVRGVDGATREVALHPVFDEPFGAAPLNFLGLVPRAAVTLILEGSSARGKLKPGDAVVAVTISGNDRFESPSPQQLRKTLLTASKSGGTVDLVVNRDGQELPPITGLVPQTKLESGERGLGVGPGYDADHTVIGEVLEDTPASRAKLPSNGTIVSVDGQPVKSWFDIHRVLLSIKQPGAISVVVRSDAGEKSHSLDVTAADLSAVGSIRYTTLAMFHPYTEERHTSNPLEAAKWGIVETRDLTLQFYLTLKRMFQGSVPASSGMGPIGIFHQGSKIAYRGNDWLIWFLAMISANLAVVNFLPIPIVDGGLFVFLILEKIMGKPLSPKAQGIAQIAGLALIAGVFLFVTYNDITRLF